MYKIKLKYPIKKASAIPGQFVQVDVIELRRPSLHDYMMIGDMSRLDPMVQFMKILVKVNVNGLTEKELEQIDGHDTIKISEKFNNMMTGKI